MAIFSRARDSVMEFFSAEFLVASGALLTTVGGALRWLVIRIDSRADKQDEREAAERKKLEDMLNQRITGLEAMLDAYRVEIAGLRLQNADYIRHVGVLEGIMRAKGMDVPPMSVTHHG